MSPVSKCPGPALLLLRGLTGLEGGTPWPQKTFRVWEQQGGVEETDTGPGLASGDLSAVVAEEERHQQLHRGT